MTLLFTLLQALLGTIFSQAPKTDTLTVAMCGDIMMGTTYPSTRLPEKDGALIFSDVKDILTTATLAVGNLEGTLCDGGNSTKTLAYKGWNRRKKYLTSKGLRIPAWQDGKNGPWWKGMAYVSGSALSGITGTPSSIRSWTR